MGQQRIAITRELSRSIGNCQLTHLDRVPIHLERAQAQHRGYVRALQAADWEVISLPEELELPDSVFVEDTAIVLDGLAIITRPGAASRRPETKAMQKELAKLLPVASISDSAQLDGGDVLVLGKQIFVGMSSRSTHAAVTELAELTRLLGYRVEAVSVEACLHLKSAVTCLDPETVLINPHWVAPEVFGAYRQIEVDPTEPDAANCVDLGSKILHGAAYPRTRQRIEAAGFAVEALPLDELAKAEGAASCCSLLIRIY